MHRIVALLLGLVMTAACDLPGASPAAGTPREIVIAADMPFGADTNPARDAIGVAIANQGSVDGYRLLYQPFDDGLLGRQDAAKAEQNVELMIQDPRTLAVIGPFNSSIAELAIPLANQAGLVMLSESNTKACLTALPSPCPKRPTNVNNYFRIAATDSAMAQAGARFALKNLGLKNFAVLSDVTRYGQELGRSFAEELIAGGGQVVFQRQYAPNLPDYTGLLQDALDARAQAVFVGGFDNTGACRIRADMVKVFPAGSYMLAGDGIFDRSCLADAGAGADSTLLALISDSQPPRDSKVSRDLARHGIPPLAYVFPAYDCAEMIIAAIDRAIRANGGKEPTRLQVLAAVAATRDFRGASGTFTLGPSGDATNPAVSVYRVEKGRFAFWQNAP